MNNLVDCSMIMNEDHEFSADVVPSLVDIAIKNDHFSATAYQFSHHSLCGTYIDLPGHIIQTDDGTNSANYPLEKLFRLRAAVIHLDRADKPGPVTRRELEKKSPETTGCQAIIINALGKKRFDQVKDGSIWLDNDAVKWIVDTGTHLVMSDVYKRLPDLNSIFSVLFSNHIATVCDPANLHLLDTPHVLLTVLPLRYTGVTQAPCRIAAELLNKETTK